jgi:hypothetical protein
VINRFSAHSIRLDEVVIKGDHLETTGRHWLSGLEYW